MSITKTSRDSYEIDGIVNINRFATDLSTAKTASQINSLGIFDFLDSGTKAAKNSELSGLTPVNSYVTPELSIAHVNGVADVQSVGILSLQASSLGAGLTGGHDLILTPDISFWKTEGWQATVKKLTVKTNILANDIPSSTVNCWRTSAYKLTSNSSGSGQRETIQFAAAAGSGGVLAIIGGSLQSPPLIGDTGTFYGSANASLGGVEDEAGTTILAYGGKCYYIFAVSIPASALTKTYKFIFQLEFV